MATSTVIAGARTSHRTARTSDRAFQGTLALDWANGQVIAISATAQSTTTFDTQNDRIVFCSVGGPSTVVGAFISVGASPTATTNAAGSLWLAQQNEPIPVYIPANAVISAVGSNTGVLMMLPALIASDP